MEKRKLTKEEIKNLVKGDIVELVYTSNGEGQTRSTHTIMMHEGKPAFSGTKCCSDPFAKTFSYTTVDRVLCGFGYYDVYVSVIDSSNPAPEISVKQTMTMEQWKKYGNIDPLAKFILDEPAPENADQQKKSRDQAFKWFNRGAVIYQCYKKSPFEADKLFNMEWKAFNPDPKINTDNPTLGNNTSIVGKEHLETFVGDVLLEKKSKDLLVKAVEEMHAAQRKRGNKESLKSADQPLSIRESNDLAREQLAGLANSQSKKSGFILEIAHKLIDRGADITTVVSVAEKLWNDLKTKGYV